jgi:hypothetical protein
MNPLDEAISLLRWVPDSTRVPINKLLLEERNRKSDLRQALITLSDKYWEMKVHRVPVSANEVVHDIEHLRYEHFLELYDDLPPEQDQFGLWL